MRINDIDLQKITPKELTHIIAEGNPKLVSSQTGSFVAQQVCLTFFFSISLTTICHFTLRYCMYTCEFVMGKVVH